MSLYSLLDMPGIPVFLSLKVLAMEPTDENWFLSHGRKVESWVEVAVSRVDEVLCLTGVFYVFLHGLRPGLLVPTRIVLHSWGGPTFYEV